MRGPCLKIRDSIPPHLDFEMSDREPEKKIQFVTSAWAMNAGLRILRLPPVLMEWSFEL